MWSMNCDPTTSQFIKHRGPMIAHVRFLGIPGAPNSAVYLLRSFVYLLGLSRKRSKRPSFGESQTHRVYITVAECQCFRVILCFAKNSIPVESRGHEYHRISQFKVGSIRFYCRGGCFQGIRAGCPNLSDTIDCSCSRRGMSAKVLIRLIILHSRLRFRA